MLRNLIFTTLLLFCITFTSVAQNAIYVTLDVSPSMYRKKYDLANYGAQMITALNQDRELTFIVNSKLIQLKDDFSPIQKKVTDFGGFTHSEIYDIEALNKTINPSIPRQDVFIIGDGYWYTEEMALDIYTSFSEIYATKNINVYYLEVLDTDRPSLEPAFGAFLRRNNIGKIYRVSSTDQITNSINLIAEIITGVSHIPQNSMLQSGTCVTFHTELGFNKLKILYQESTRLQNLPEIKSLKVDGRDIPLSTLATPTNESFESKSGGLMSGRIYEAIGNIPKNAKVEICFSSVVNIDNLMIYPISEVQTGNFTLSGINGSYEVINDNTIGICKDNEQIDLEFEFMQQQNAITDGVIEKAKVVVESDGIKYQAVFQNGKFRTTLPLTGESTYYTIKGELEGYFRYTSDRKEIVKTDQCGPPLGGEVFMGTLHFGSITLSELMREGRIKGVIVDKDTGEKLGPENFDIELKNNYPMLFKSVRMEFLPGDTIDFIIEPRGQWCDCFIPDQLSIDFKSAPKEGYLIDGKQYQSMNYELLVDIIKEENWFSRCKWLIFVLLGSLLLAWFLILLSRKQRFGRGTRVVFRYPNMTSRHSLNPEYTTTDFRLRKKGLGAWLNRWINPFVTEKNTLSFHNINLSMLFIASKSIRQIYFPKVSFNEDTMESINYDPDSRNKNVLFDENSEIQVAYKRGALGTTNNFLEYSYPKRAWNDIATFRLVLGILIAACFGFFIVTLIFLIKSLF